MISVAETEKNQLDSAILEEDNDDVDDDDVIQDFSNKDIVQEILDNIQDSYLPSVDNFRKFVRKVRMSQLYESVLKEACSEIGMPYKALVKDMPVRWNSTYDMIL